MRISLFICIGILFSEVAFAQASGSYAINGTVKGADGKYVYLGYALGLKYVADSVLVRNGKFTFNGILPNPVLASISVDQEADSDGGRRFFLEPAQMRVKLDKGGSRLVEVTGGQINIVYQKYLADQAGIRAQWKQVGEDLDRISKLAGDKEDSRDSARFASYKVQLEELRTKTASLGDKLKQMDKEFIQSNPSSYLSGYLLFNNYHLLAPDESSRLYHLLNEEIKESTFGKYVLAELEKEKLGIPGTMAYVFTKTGIDGKRISLSDFRGRYVLLDFWASWCVPCRKGNPHLIEIYKKYKDKGFEIIGISDDDRDHVAWEEAVKKDGIGMWKHVLRGFDIDKMISGELNPNDIDEYYNIKTLPTKILIDKQGMIIGRYSMDDKELDAKLAELLPAKEELTLNVNLIGNKDSVVSISYYDDKGLQTAKVPVKNGQFTWKQKLNEPQKITIDFSDRYMDFFVDNADIQIQGQYDSLDKVKVTGSPWDIEFGRYYSILGPIINERQAIFQNSLSAKGNEKLEAEYEAKLKLVNKKLDAKKVEYVVENPSSPISVSIVEEFGFFEEGRFVDSLYALLTPEAKSSAAGKRVLDRIGVLKRSEIGSTMKDFAMTTIDGKPVKISDFRGKYLFVDFWASWCGPCRAENPNVLKAYNRFKNKNFTVLGISIDDNKDQWKQAVKKDKMPWTQVLDKKVAEYFGIEAIPATFLLDPQGKIIHKGLRGTELNKVLSEILDPQSK